jgi:hypothetical protein
MKFQILNNKMSFYHASRAFLVSGQAQQALHGGFFSVDADSLLTTFVAAGLFVSVADDEVEAPLPII